MNKNNHIIQFRILRSDKDKYDYIKSESKQKSLIRDIFIDYLKSEFKSEKRVKLLADEIVNFISKANSSSYKEVMTIESDYNTQFIIQIKLVKY